MLEVARGLFFNHTLQAAADQAVSHMRGSFNGLHLRLEADSGWVAKMGGLQVMEADMMTMLCLRHSVHVHDSC
jgi:hypothetical protein